MEDRGGPAGWVGVYEVEVMGLEDVVCLVDLIPFNLSVIKFKANPLKAPMMKKIRSRLLLFKRSSGRLTIEPGSQILRLKLPSHGKDEKPLQCRDTSSLSVSFT